MKILTLLSVRNLKLNKKRTISTIIGIILSVALICAVASMALSFQATLVENAKNELGYYHIELKDIKEEDLKNIKNNRDIKDIYQVKRCGYAKLIGSKNKDKPYVRLNSMDEETFDNLSFKLIEGSFPKDSKELVISNTINSNAKLNYKIGDTIELDVGERKASDNSKLNGNNPYMEEDEQIINTKKYNFKIVGIIERPNTNFENFGDSGYTIISTGINQGENNLYISLKAPKQYETSLTELLGAQNYKNVKEHDIKVTKYEYSVNQELLRWEAFAFSDSTIAMLFCVVGVVIFVILFTSVFCIRNSFAIATTEKIKMYSMLASVGTTKRQIRKNVITEGLILGTIGIPLGILFGLIAVFVLIKFVNILIGDYLLGHVDGIVFKISFMPILLSIILGVITIYLSARSSAKKASKVSPIEGLKNSKDIQINSRKLKVPRIISTIFKTGGDLAYKNLKRSKKKYRTTVISISVSIFIFITMSVFIVNAFDFSSNYYKDSNYNLQVSPPTGADFTEEELKKILSHQSIEQYSLLHEIEGDTFKIKDLSKIKKSKSISYIMTEESYDEEKDKIIESEEKYIVLNINALDTEAFKRYVKEIGVKYEDVKGSGILCDEFKDYSEENGKEKVSRIYTYSKGDNIEGEFKNKKVSIKVGAISSVKPDGMKNTSYSGGNLIVEINTIKELKFSLYGIAIKSKDVNQLEDDLKSINSNMNLFNLEEAVNQEKSMILVIKIFLYGFIAVITLIGVTNIFNTITANMELRQKEFAMLKSIGMTNREFNRMINLETIFYGTKAWVYGTILGLLGTVAMYKAFSVKIDKGIYIPIDSILISAIFVFLFVFIIMKYSIKKINKQNTIETIRKENI